MTAITPQQTEQYLRNFVNLSDKQVRTIARVDAASDYKDSKSRKFGNFAFKSVPVVDTIAAGVLAGTAIAKSKTGETLITKTAKTLSQKLGKGMKTAGFWAGAIGLISVLNGINNGIKAKSPKYAKFRENHKGLNFFTDIAIFLGSWVGAIKGIKSLSKAIKPTNFGDFISKNTKAMAESIDKSLVAKFNTEKVAPLFKKMAEKFPKSSKAGALILANAAFIGIGIGFLSKIVAGAKYNNKQNKTYANLKEAQFHTAVNLLNKTQNIV